MANKPPDFQYGFSTPQPTVPGYTAKSSLGPGQEYAKYPANVKRGRGSIDNSARDNSHALQDLIAGAGYYTGGSSGGSGNGYAALRSALAGASARYNTNRQQVADLYGQLRDAIAPNAGLTDQRYQTAITSGSRAGNDIAAKALASQDAQDQQRDTALGSLGVDPHQAASQADTATNQGVTNLANNQSTWGNLMGVLNNAQQSRDKLDLQGAVDAGVLAQSQLLDGYNAYANQLQSSYRGGGGGGGSAPTYHNPLADKYQNSVFQQLLAANGLGGSPQVDYTQYLPGIAAAIGDGSGTRGQTVSKILSGPDPAQTLAAYRKLGVG